MSALWGALDLSTWADAPSTRGRLASEADVKNGSAVFYIELSGGAKAEALDVALPFCARLVSEQGTVSSVVVIQAVSTERGVVAGFRKVEGGNGICLYQELERVSEPNESFFERVRTDA